jgi:8-oxo-dGTP pyrophosphatase MutT (NUDIX family)
MNYEKSCGAVVFQKVDGEIRYLLISSLEGIYGFPKGHMEGNETEIETALREVKEETNLDIELIAGFRTSTEYMLPKKQDTLKIAKPPRITQTPLPNSYTKSL